MAGFAKNTIALGKNCLLTRVTKWPKDKDGDESALADAVIKVNNITIEKGARRDANTARWP